MSNDNNLEQQPHYDEVDSTVYSNDDAQQHQHDEYHHLTPDSDYEPNEDMNETVLVPGDSEFDPEYKTDTESVMFNDDDSVALDSITAENENDDDDVPEVDATSESELMANTPEEVPATPVDITILHEDYTIFCPQGEEQALFQATHYINDFIDGIREDAPTLSQKNLLVLACLNLYEKMKQAEVAAKSDEETLQHANRMVEQMIDDMQLDD